MPTRTRLSHKQKPRANNAPLATPAFARSRDAETQAPTRPRYGYDFREVRLGAGDDVAMEPGIAGASLHLLPTSGVGAIQRQEAAEANAAQSPAPTREQKIAAYDEAVQATDWQQVAERLNGFDDADILRLLRKLRREQGKESVREVYAAALQHMPGFSERVHKPIERLLHINSATSYVGLNPKAGKEAGALKRQAPGKVLVSLNNPEAEKTLNDSPGQQAFLRQLGLRAGESQFEAALKCLQESDSAYRDQVADLVRMFFNASQGQYRLERLVLSGHHNASGMWGDPDTWFTKSRVQPGRELSNLAAAFPIAAAQVQDVMLSACNSTNEVDGLKAAFPNLQSIWVYRGLSPNVEQGSPGHIQHWERTTRGERKPHHSDEVGNAAVWTKQDGMLIEV